MTQHNKTSSVFQITLILLIWVVAAGCTTGRTSPYHPDRPNERKEGVLHYEEYRDLFRGGRRWRAVYEKGFRGRQMAQQINAYMEQAEPVDHELIRKSAWVLRSEEINELSNAQLKWVAQELLSEARVQRQLAAQELQIAEEIKNDKSQWKNYGMRAHRTAPHRNRASGATFRADRYTELSFQITDYLNRRNEDSLNENSE